MIWPLSFSFAEAVIRGVFCKKVVVINFEKFTAKELRESLFLIKLQAVACNIIKDAPSGPRQFLAVETP